MSESSTADWNWINAAADRFERGWKEGLRPRIEDYLAEADEPRRAALLEELLRVELELRRRTGEEPVAEEYHERFPGSAEVLEVVFAKPSDVPIHGDCTPPDDREHGESIHRSQLRRLFDKLAGAPGSVPCVLLRDTESSIGEPLVRPASLEIPPDGGRYQILGEIGRGGMGAVMKGRDPDLGRDLAVKVLLNEHQDEPDLVRRFIEEAQIGGQLQHPGIVPVYELGVFNDRRPFFTMKLVKGRTLAALLKERRDPADDLPRLLSIFEHVCQTVAYAHARSVIHRDLKPSNIMVGAFGEVQVMDWGFAKVLPRGGTADEPRHDVEEMAVSVIHTVRTGSEADASRPGSAMGTPAYMAPEQAGGDVDSMDERTDVFALGSILCELLTGSPAYTGPSRDAIFRKAIRGDTAEAVRRLEACVADREVVALARRCLAAERDERPRDAGEVARMVTTYTTGVQERTRKAELDAVEARARAEEETKRRVLADDLAREAQARADEEAKGRDLATRLAREAEARAVEERKRRRVTVGLAASVLALACFGGGTWLVRERSRTERRVAAEHALDETRRLHRTALTSEENDDVRWAEAFRALERARGLLAQGGEARQKHEVDELDLVMTEDRDLARRQAEWVARLNDIRSSWLEGGDISGCVANFEYSAVFREAAIDPDALGPDEVGVRIRALRPTTVQAMISGLDDWLFLRMTTCKDEIGAQLLLEAARAADPDAWRNRLREVVRTWHKKPRGELAELAKTARPDQMPAVNTFMLAASLWSVKDLEGSIDLLREGLKAYPRDIWMNHRLAWHLDKVGKSDEAFGFYMAARALYPESAHQLAHLLQKKGRPDEAIAVFQDLARLRPQDIWHRQCLSMALESQGREQEDEGLVESLLEGWQRAVSQDARSPVAHSSLARSLMLKHRFDEAIAQSNEALRLDPNVDLAREVLAGSLERQGKLEEAISQYRTTVRLKPDSPLAHYNLGMALKKTGKLVESIEEDRAAVKLLPDDPNFHFGLACGLHDQFKLPEAIAEYRAAIQLAPKDVRYRINLGKAVQDLGDYDQAIREYEAALRIRPDFADVQSLLGKALWQGKRDFAAAMRVLEDSVRRHPDSAECHSDVGSLLCDAKHNYAAGEASFRKAIQLKPNVALYHRNLGNALHGQSKFVEALVEFQKATGLEPNNAEAHISLGSAFEEQNRLEEAISEFRAAIRINPNDPRAHSSLGHALDSAGKAEEAITEIREAIRLNREAAKTRAGEKPH